MPQKRTLGFTLVELLVVVTIIIALLAILLPSMSRAIQVSEEAVCAADTRTMCTVSLSYASDSYGNLPDLSRLIDGGAQVSNIYWTYREWADHLEDRYGISQQHYYPLTNPSWSGDVLYHWDAQRVVMGRFYFGSTLANADGIYNNLFDPLPATARPLFPQRIGTSSHWKMLWADLNREWLATPGTIDWAKGGATYIGASHLYSGDVHAVPAGTHVGLIDASVSWTPGARMAPRTIDGGSTLWW